MANAAQDGAGFRFCKSSLCLQPLFHSTLPVARQVQCQGGQGICPSLFIAYGQRRRKSLMLGPRIFPC